MKSTITCLHCGEKVPQNPRINNQKYCPGKECQQSRMRAWKREQYHKNKKYQENIQARGKVWRKFYPANDYQRDFRNTHPEYVKRNREQQRIRNKKRQKEQSSMIVKTDALSLRPSIDGAYALFRIKEKMIVNRNALMAAE
ncbi:MAG: hypothetical protein M0Q26_15295 [Chitinophagaceae bacterium]|nr:hypothetical protein [Chitinophagaceae bacterium]